jgi:hypothetical protein
MSSPWTYALSVRQPWAALIVAGVKTIEIRRWPTAHRGRLLIHAASLPDPREEGWRLVTPRMDHLLDLRGGIIGAVELLACRRYCSRRDFVADQELHRNDPSWYKPDLFGFILANPEPVGFHPFKGNVRLFRVALPESAGAMRRGQGRQRKPRDESH